MTRVIYFSNSKEYEMLFENDKQATQFSVSLQLSGLTTSISVERVQE